MTKNSRLFTKNEWQILQDILTDAGELALRYFGKNIKNWQKDDDTPVTEADLAVNDFLAENLYKLRPEFGWLSEETTDDPARLKQNYVWLIDPIDGTKAFIKGQAEWAISVAIVKDNRPILGLVYDPVAKILYTAEQHFGAFANGRKIAATSRPHIIGANILAYEFHFAHMAQFSGYVWPQMQYNIVNSMAMRVSLVAAGRFDAMVSFTNKGEWDMAAADIIIHEAGGIISDGFGNRLIYNKPKPSLPHMVAAGTQLHQLIIQHTMNFNFKSKLKL